MLAYRVRHATAVPEIFARVCAIARCRCTGNARHCGRRVSWFRVKRLPLAAVEIRIHEAQRSLLDSRRERVARMQRLAAAGQGSRGAPPRRVRVASAPKILRMPIASRRFLQCRRPCGRIRGVCLIPRTRRKRLQEFWHSDATRCFFLPSCSQAMPAGPVLLPPWTEGSKHHWRRRLSNASSASSGSPASSTRTAESSACRASSR